MKNIVIKQSSIDFILCVLLAVVFAASIFVSYKFLTYDYKSSESTLDDNRSITVPYDGLIEGNTSGNMAQYMIDGSKNRVSYGSFCVKSKYMYYKKEDRNKAYLIKSSVDNPSSEYPILEGYDVEYINAVNNKLFFVARLAGTFDCKRIYTMDLEGGDMTAFDLGFTRSVSSMVTNSNYLYFTVEGSPNIYSISLDGKRINSLASFTDSEIGVRLFGVDKTHVYFVNDGYMGKVDFSTGEKTRLTNDCFGIYQCPILTPDGIMFYSSISNTDYMFISKAGGPASKLFNAAQVQKILETDSFVRYVNYSSGYVFLVIGQNVYYAPFGSSELNLLKGITLSENGRAFFSDEYCIGETEDGLKSININWILSV